MLNRKNAINPPPMNSINIRRMMGRRVNPNISTPFNTSASSGSSCLHHRPLVRHATQVFRQVQKVKLVEMTLEAFVTSLHPPPIGFGLLESDDRHDHHRYGDRRSLVFVLFVLVIFRR